MIIDADWLDPGTPLGEAWTSYVKNDWDKAMDAASRALSAATETIAREADKEVAAMAAALRSQAAALVVTGCVHERLGEYKPALAKFREASRNPGEAILAMLNAITGDPGLAGARIGLAAAFSGQDFATEALAFLQGLRNDPGQLAPVLRAAAYAQEAQARYAVGDYGMAIERMREAIGLDSEDDDGWMHGTQGFALLAQALTEAAESPRAMAPDRLEEARAAFQFAREKDDANWWWRRGLADVYDALGQSDKAKELYRSICQDAQKHPEKLDAAAFEILAWCYQRLGMQDEAVSQIVNSTHLKPNLVFNQFDLALILLAMGPDAALWEYKEAVRLVTVKPIPRRYGLLHEGLINFEAEVRRRGIEGEEVVAIRELLTESKAEAKRLWDQIRNQEGQIWKWACVPHPVIPVYNYLSNHRNWADFMRSMELQDEASAGSGGAGEQAWRLRGDGLRALSWRARVVERSPFYRVSYINVPPDERADPDHAGFWRADQERDGFSCAVTLVPVKNRTVVLLRLVYPKGLLTEQEVAALAEQLEGDLQRLSTVDIAARFQRSRMAI